MNYATNIIIIIEISKKMERKNENPIYDYYQQLSSEPRGTMGKFVLFVCYRTGVGQTTALRKLRENDWSPAERDDIMRSMRDGSWRDIAY